MKKKLWIIPAASVVMVLFSCPAPIEPEMLSILKDLEAPKIIVTSPPDYGEYATIIKLEGYIEDESIGNIPDDTSLSLTYRIPGSSLGGTATVSPATGNFSALIDASVLSGDQIIELSTADINGNKAETRVNIRKPEDGGDISGFTVTPANKQITLSWDPVPGAESYSIFESNYGLTVEGNDISGTSYTWEGLKNGEIYSFQLTAHLPSASGSNAISAEIAKMPLSTRTFAPYVKENGYGSITIGWQKHANVDKYVVERSLSPAGPWEIRRILTENEFVDYNTEKSTKYYYRVYPKNYKDIKSTFIDTTPGFFGYKIEAGSFSQRAWDVSISGEHAFVVGSSRIMQIVNIKDVSAPYIISWLDLPGNTEWVTSNANYVYTSSGSSGLQIIDISDLYNPVIVGAYDTPDSAKQAVVSEGYAYIADMSSVQIIDISSPNLPIFSGSCEMPEGAQTQGIDIEGQYAFVAAGLNGLLIIDIADPSSPFIAGSYDTPGYANGLCVAGDYAYIADDITGLQIIDITDKYHPLLIGNIDTEGTARNVTTEGSLAFVADDANGIQIIDITDPSAPGFAGRLLIPGRSFRCMLNNSYIIAATEPYGLQIIEMTIPGEPVVVSSFASEEKIIDVTTSNSLAFAIERDNQLHIYDVSVPEFCSEIGSHHIDQMFSITIAGQNAYITTSGLQIIDISNSYSPKTAGTCIPLTFPYLIAVAGETAYIAAGSAGLKLVNISDPYSPFEISSIEIPGIAQDILVSGENAYIAGSSNGVFLIDVSNPFLLSQIEICDTPGSCRQLTNSGSFLYVADGENGLQIIDISNPESPSIVGNYNTPGSAEQVVISGSYAFIADDSEGIQIIDIADPASPVIVNNLKTSGSIKHICIDGSYAYVSDDSAGFTVIDLLGNR